MPISSITYATVGLVMIARNFMRQSGSYFSIATPADFSVTSPVASSNPYEALTGNDTHFLLARNSILTLGGSNPNRFDSLWLTRREVEAVHAAGRKFYAISPELHGFDEAARLKRWQQFKDWQIDGLCTDYALSAREFFLR